jgi:hypothetical protein
MPPSEDEDATLEDVEEAAESEQEDDLGEGEDFSPFEELADEFSPSQIITTTGPDGLPMLSAPEAGASDIPVFSCETLVCIGDYSQFHDSEGRVYDKALVKRNRTASLEVFPEGEYQTPYVVANVAHHLPVIPKRLPCVHYVRQMVQFEHNPEVKMISRLCSARRDRQGAFMSVRDRAVWACDMRNPPDPESTKLLDDFDNKKLKEGRERTFDSIFGKVKE